MYDMQIFIDEKRTGVFFVNPGRHLSFTRNSLKQTFSLFQHLYHFALQTKGQSSQIMQQFVWDSQNKHKSIPRPVYLLSCVSSDLMFRLSKKVIKCCVRSGFFSRKTWKFPMRRLDFLMEFLTMNF